MAEDDTYMQSPIVTIMHDVKHTRLEEKQLLGISDIQAPSSPPPNQVSP
jgi:hypothetical protein